MKAKVQTNFKSSYKAGYVAKDIAQFYNRGTAIKDKIEIVLNQLRELTDTKSLKTLSQDAVQAFVDTLTDRIDNGELKTKTTSTYISALNDIIRYTNENLNKNLDTVSAKENSLNTGHIEYMDRSVSQELSSSFQSYISQQEGIQSQALAHSVALQKEFGLRLRESLAIKRETLQNALKDGKLRLSRKDMTKDARKRIIPLTKDSQRESIARTLDFMKKNHLQSLIPVQTLKQQYNFAEKVRASFIKSSGEHFRYHDLRHTFAHNLKKEGANEKDIAKRLGHGRLEKTYTA